MKEFYLQLPLYPNSTSHYFLAVIIIFFFVMFVVHHCKCHYIVLGRKVACIILQTINHNAKKTIGRV